MFSVTGFQERRRSKLGDPIYYFEELESTNTTAELLAREGCPEGTMVLGNCQSAGRGRKGAGWFSPAGLNLYFSLVLRPDTASLRFLPYIASLAVQRALQQIGIDADLKWPNDVLVDERKICGILIQTAMEDGRLLFAVVGFGINVNVLEFPAELQDVATSVALHKGSAEPREALLASLLLEFERLYETIDSVSWPEFVAEMEASSSYLRDCPVRILQEGVSLEGTTKGLDSFGGLRIQTAKGEKTVYAGEVLSCRKK